MDSETAIAEAKLPLHSLVFQIHVPTYVGEGFFFTDSIFKTM